MTPILVFLGPLLGHPLDLTFTTLELGALGAAVILTGFVALDGKSNWLEGAMLCGVYAIARPRFLLLALAADRDGWPSFAPPAAGPKQGSPTNSNSRTCRHDRRTAHLGSAFVPIVETRCTMRYSASCGSLAPRNHDR